MKQLIVVSAVMAVLILVLLWTSNSTGVGDSDDSDAPAPERSSVTKLVPAIKKGSVPAAVADDSEKQVLPTAAKRRLKSPATADGAALSAPKQKKAGAVPDHLAIRDPDAIGDNDPLYHGWWKLYNGPKPAKSMTKPTIAKVLLEKSAIAEACYNNFQDSFDEKNIAEGAVIPALVSPTLHDGDVLRHTLLNLNAPFRHWVFIVNAEDDEVNKVMAELEPLAAIGAISVLKFEGENRGFAASTNLGFRKAREVLLGHSEFGFLPAWPAGQPLWYFSVNCDAVFRPGSGRHFASGVNLELRKPESKGGVFYGHVVDQYAFAITDHAIRAAGYFDEVFFPAYMEDIDFKWRIHNAGFDMHKTEAVIDHHQSINLKRGGLSKFREQMHRGGLGFEYGWMKWGHYEQHHTTRPLPPSGRRTPFGIKNFPLHLWKVDPKHRRCIADGQGTYLLGSSSCWYNGSGLLLEPTYPKGEPLPRFLREPVTSMRDYLRHGAKNNRQD